MRTDIPADALLIEPFVTRDPKAFAQLVLDIAAKGVTRPLLVTRDLSVIHRKAEAAAAKMIRLPSVPVEIIDTDEYLADGNGHHEYTPTEIVAIGRLLEEALKPLSEQRRVEGRARAVARKAGQDVTLLPPAERLKVRDVVAKCFGIGGTTYGRAREIVSAAEADPEQFEDLLTEMDTTGAVYATHDELQRRRKGTVEEPPLPRPKAAGSPVKLVPGRGRTAVVQNTLYSLQAAADTFDEMDVDDIPCDLAAVWAKDLAAMGRSFMRFRIRLNKRAKEIASD